jgi:calcium/calmodulin-dependent protein kinase I
MSQTKYELVVSIGKGAFSEVFRGRDQVTGKEVAIKVIQKDKILESGNEKSVQRLQTEIVILQNVSHPNIIKFIDLYESSNTFHVIMELVTGGTLMEKIVNKGCYSEGSARNIVKQILEALKYLHNKGIVHRDLKAENILLRTPSSEDVVVTDFGLSRILNDSSMMASLCGTPYAVAPEVLSAKGYRKVVDLWSTGVIAYFILCGFPPFVAETVSEVFEQILSADYDFPSQYWGKVSMKAKNFVSSLLVLEPDKRLDAEQALKHEWVVSP